MMAYPRLVRNPRTPVRVVIETEEPNEYNERVTLLDADLMCNYQDSSKVKYTKDKQDPGVTGSLFFDGDILPGCAVLSSGYVEIFGEKREIDRGSKGRNPDGSVNYTRLDVV